MQKRFLFAVTVCLIGIFVLGSCGPAQPAVGTEPEVMEVTREVQVEVTSEIEVTRVVEATAAPADPLAGEGVVVIYSWGGSATEGLRKNVYASFTEDTGISVVDVYADFSEAQVKAMVEAGNVTWDIAAPQAHLYPEMSEAGMFEEIDYSLWREEDIEAVPEHLRHHDAVPMIQSFMVLGYDRNAYPEGTEHPDSWADFWDVEQFPGPRGLYAPAAKQNLVAALCADGMPKDEIWPLTEEKVDRALAKLDEIAPHITKWWTSGGEAPQLLINGEVVMTSAFDGRMITAIRAGAENLGVEWECAPGNVTYYAIVKGAPNLENAQKFLAYVNRPEVAAEYVEAISYPGGNTNAVDYIDPQLVPLLSIAPENASKVVWDDSAWLAENIDGIQERWLEWQITAGVE